MANQRHFVDRFGRTKADLGGMVGCPIHGQDVEVDQCLACGRLDRIALAEKLPFIVCDGEPSAHESAIHSDFAAAITRWR
jgi:hypothetical protein